MRRRPGDRGQRSGQPSPEELYALDAFLDALVTEPVPAAVVGGTPSTGEVDAGLAAMAHRLSGLPEGAWDSVAPLYQPPAPVVGMGSRRPRLPHGRRAAVVAWVATVAAVVVVLAVVGINAFSGQPPTCTAMGVHEPWRLAGFIDQAAWQPTASVTLGASVSVTCPTSGTCYADDLGGSGAGVVEVTTDAGADWQASSLPAGARPTSSPACPEAADCFVAATTAGSDGASILVTSDGGATWTAHPIPDLSLVVELACPSTDDCLAAGYGAPSAAEPDGAPAVARTTDAGTTWLLAALPADFAPSWPGGLSCTGGACAPVGTDAAVSDTPSTAGATGAALSSVDGGVSWTPSTVPGGISIVRAVSCATATDCVAVGNADLAGASAVTGHPYGPSVALTTRDGGRTWTSTGQVATGTTFLTGLSCPTTSQCWSVGLETAGSGTSTLAGQIERTTDGGATWTAEALPTELTPAQQQSSKLSSLDIEDVSSVSCPTAAHCVALAAEGSSTNPTPLHLALGN